MDLGREAGFLPSLSAVLVLVLLGVLPLSFMESDLGGAVRAEREALEERPRSPLRGFIAADDLRRRAYRELDPTLMRLALTSDGRASAAVGRELGKLQRYGIRDRTAFHTLSLELLSQGSLTARLRQRVIVAPRFIGLDGEDRTFGVPQLQEILWDLRRVHDDWLIHSGRVVRGHAVDGREE